MKTKFLTLLALTMASQAQAHSGAHLHPHGVEGWMVGAGVLAVACAALIAVAMRR